MIRRIATMLLVSIAIEAAGCAGGGSGSHLGTLGGSERDPAATQFSAGGSASSLPAISGFITADKTTGFQGRAAKRPEFGFHLNLPPTQIPLAGARVVLQSATDGVIALVMTAQDGYFQLPVPTSFAGQTVAIEITSTEGVALPAQKMRPQLSNNDQTLCHFNVAGTLANPSVTQSSVLTFASDSDRLTNELFPYAAGDVRVFAGTGSFEGRTWTFAATAGSWNGIKALKLRTEAVTGKVTFELEELIVAQAVDGAVYLLESFEFNDGELEVLPEPIKIVPPRSDLSVGFRYHSGDDDDDFALVQSTTDSVMTPSLGTFRSVVCLVDDDDDDTDADGDDDDEAIYFASGAGIVREDWNDTYGSGDIGGPAVPPNGWILRSGTLNGLALPVQP